MQYSTAQHTQKDGQRVRCCVLATVADQEHLPARACGCQLNDTTEEAGAVSDVLSCCWPRDPVAVVLFLAKLMMV